MRGYVRGLHWLVALVGLVVALFLTPLRVRAGGGTCTSNSDCADASNLSCDCVGAACGWIDTYCSIPAGEQQGTCSSKCVHSGGVSCLPAGTRVMMESGQEREIEQVRIGDRVVSQSEAGERAVSQVSAIETPMRDHMCTVTFADGGRLRLTDEHPLYTQGGCLS